MTFQFEKYFLRARGRVCGMITGMLNGFKKAVNCRLLLLAFVSIFSGIMCVWDSFDNCLNILLYRFELVLQIY